MSNFRFGDIAYSVAQHLAFVGDMQWGEASKTRRL